MILLTSAWPSLAADAPTVTIPKLSKPLVEPVEGDPLQSDYDKMWEDYEATLTKARDGIVSALDKQIAKATEAGELDQLEKWEAVKKQFASDGTLSWDTSAKATAEWKKVNPKVPFPREFNDAVRSSVNLADSAKEKLEEGYAALVKAYTKAESGEGSGSGPVAAGSQRGRGPTASSNSRRMSSLTGSPISSRRRGSTGIATTEYSRRITS